MPAENRFYYMDWLRVLAMGFVFLVHTSMPFAEVEDPWLIRFDQTKQKHVGVIAPPPLAFLHEAPLAQRFSVTG